MTSDLEAKAREWLQTHCSHESFAVFGETWTEPLAALLRSVAAEARKEALGQAAIVCDKAKCAEYRSAAQYESRHQVNDDKRAAMCDHAAAILLDAARRIRALAGRKEGT